MGVNAVHFRLADATLWSLPVINRLNLDNSDSEAQRCCDACRPRRHGMKILLVEDEIQTAAHLRKGLMQNGFAVDVASRCAMPAVAGRGAYDLVILDTRSGLPPNSDGPSTVAAAPVLLLADRQPLPSSGFSPQGSYLVKPFTFSEFLSEVRRLLPGNATGSALISRIADLELDLERHRATRAGYRLDLTPKEFLLLSLLMRNSGTVLSRTVIADQVWDINFESHTNFVDVHIRRLRSKADDPFPNKLIHTVRGSGYVLEDRRAAPFDPRQASIDWTPAYRPRLPNSAPGHLRNNEFIFAGVSTTSGRLPLDAGSVRATVCPESGSTSAAPQPRKWVRFAKS